MPYRLAPYDLADPVWEDPWFPHGAFVASLAFWYGLVIFLVLPVRHKQLTSRRRKLRKLLTHGSDDRKPSP